MDITLYTNKLMQFRSTLYQNFDNRADTLMELVDAMCSMLHAKSVVEYSLAPCFRRSYSTIFMAVDELSMDEMWLAKQVGAFLPRPQKRAFWLLLVDVTPCPRPYAHTLQDRGMVYEPEVVKSKAPVTIGHQYSTVALGLEPEPGVSSSWVLPLLTRRVATDEDKELIGAEQIARLLEDEGLPFHRDLTVEVGDTSYSKPEYLCAHRKFPNLVTIARVRGNRVFYRQPSSTAEVKSGPGHPTWYGKRFALSEPETWGELDDTLSLWETSSSGKRYRIELQAWHDLLMPGKQKPERLPMHEHPFTLVRIVRYDEQGNLACRRPLWVLVMGERRHELALEEIYQAYASRFDLEHFFRFGKQRLLMVAFQTPEVEREEKWWQLAHLAYGQLWMARHVAEALPRPWERNLPTMKQRRISPTLVQRDFARIIRQLGTPARPPKPRGISPGRRRGAKLPKRPRRRVVVKGRKVAKAA